MKSTPASLLPALLLLLGACAAPEDSSLTAGAGAPAPAEAPPEALAPATALEQSVQPGINANFLASDLDVDRFVRTFEGESREIAVHRDEILASLGLAEGMAVADVGAGTGLFLAPLAEAVGSGGRVFAVDISPRFVEHLEQRAAQEGLAQVQVVQCAEDSVELPPASVDAVLVCDTYHHFEYPRSTLASLHAALRPGGRLVVVDFERIPGVSREWTLDHVRAGKDVFRAEIEAAGFRFEDELEVPGMEENYLLRFRR
jgi:predicted methyltransferase